jgi:hypothetical protein
MHEEKQWDKRCEAVREGAEELLVGCEFEGDDEGSEEVEGVL